MSMLRRTLVFLPLVLLSVQCFGATPVATVSSKQPVVVSGITVPTDRLVSWPVNVNDEITTQQEPAMVRFADGTSVQLQRNSRMRLDASPSGVKVNVLSGSAMYDLKPRSTVSLTSAVTKNASLSADTAARLVNVDRASRGLPALRFISQNEGAATVLAQNTARTGIVLPVETVQATLASGGTFASGGNGTNRRVSFIPSNRDTITLPDGTILLVNFVGGGPGNTATFIIDQVICAAKGSNGDTIYITRPDPFNSPLAGASIVVPTSQNGITQMNVDFSNVRLLNGTPISTGQFAALLAQDCAAAYNDPRNFFDGGTQPPAPPNPFSGGDYRMGR